MLRLDMSEAHCATAELYLTDLCFDENAEGKCEAAVAQACELAPDNPTAFQLQASLRLSQERPQEAQAALMQCVQLWQQCPEELLPDFDFRTQTSSLLMEAGLFKEATSCLEVLVQEDDSHPEVWYLLARCHATLSAPESAVECLETASELFKAEAQANEGGGDMDWDGAEGAGAEGADNETLQGQVAELLAEQSALMPKDE